MSPPYFFQCFLKPCCRCKVCLWLFKRQGLLQFAWVIIKICKFILMIHSLAETCGILCTDLNHIRREQMSVITLSKEEASGSGIFHRTVGNIIWSCKLQKEKSSFKLMESPGRAFVRAGLYWEVKCKAYTVHRKVLSITRNEEIVDTMTWSSPSKEYYSVWRKFHENAFL